jgi:DNA-directed RNA polymerase subunit RPC12/RpoP
VVFLEYVHAHLRKTARDIRRERRYVCQNCGKAVKDKEAVENRLKQGKTFVYCQHCDKKVKLLDHIEQRLGTDPLARKVAEMQGKPVEEVIASRIATIPARRFGTPEEFGAACAFFCSAQAGFITGQNLLLDGGQFNSALG